MFLDSETVRPLPMETVFPSFRTTTLPCGRFLPFDTALVALRRRRHRPPPAAALRLRGRAPSSQPSLRRLSTILHSDTLTLTPPRTPPLPPQVDMYYNGYCNNVLWPLFHYVPLPFEARLDETTNVQSQWEAYQRANKLFANAVLSKYQDGDAVWCHDYHLLLLPSLLREHVPKARLSAAAGTRPCLSRRALRRRARP